MLPKEKNIKKKERKEETRVSYLGNNECVDYRMYCSMVDDNFLEYNMMLCVQLD